MPLNRILQSTIYAMIAGLLPPFALLAQVCTGGIPFSETRFQGQAAVELESTSSFFSASAGMGGQKYYGLGTIGVRKYEATDGATVLLQVGAGRAFSWRRTGAAAHCFEIIGTFGTGPDNVGELGADLSSSAIQFGFNTGVPFALSESVRLTPYVGAAAVYSSIVSTIAGTGSSVNDFYEYFSFGFGLTFSELYSVRPFARIVIDRDVNDPIFGALFSVKIGDPVR